MREFGQAPADGRRTQQRPGAYGVIIDPRRRVAVVEIETTETLLPGGGLEGDESPEDALHREVAEETGMQVQIVHALGIACEWVHSESWSTYKIGHYFLCRPIAEGDATEPDHTLLWWDAERASSDLTSPAHQWMVRRAIEPG